MTEIFLSFRLKVQINQFVECNAGYANEATTVTHIFLSLQISQRQLLPTGDIETVSKTQWNDPFRSHSVGLQIPGVNIQTQTHIWWVPFFSAKTCQLSPHLFPFTPPAHAPCARHLGVRSCARRLAQSHTQTEARRCQGVNAFATRPPVFWPSGPDRWAAQEQWLEICKEQYQHYSNPSFKQINCDPCRQAARRLADHRLLLLTKCTNYSAIFAALRHGEKN